MWIIIIILRIFKKSISFVYMWDSFIQGQRLKEWTQTILNFNSNVYWRVDKYSWIYLHQKNLI